MYMRLAFCTFLLFLKVQSYAQNCPCDAKPIKSINELNATIKLEPQKQFVDLKKAVKGVVVDLRYATKQNFTKTILYKNPAAFMRQLPANALAKVQIELQKQGLGLKIFDAYRPFSATCAMWRLTPNRHYVANPRKGSNHNRGTAIDLTLVDLKTGKELDMGTSFDSFSDSASHTFTKLPRQVLANRALLKETMHQAGFTALPKEWWHYTWKEKSKSTAWYEVMDIGFDEIASNRSQ